MTWNAVVDNAEKQRSKFTSLAGAAGQEIEHYYPELHDARIGGQFVTATGKPLLADLITSAHVVVDLYPYGNEAEIIARYGVDFSFLCDLRDRKLITLAANADVQRFEKCEWMHGVLSDQRTIFRSVRTPLFFSTIEPNIGEEREDLSAYLFRRFSARKRAGGGTWLWQG